MPTVLLQGLRGLSSAASGTDEGELQYRRSCFRDCAGSPVLLQALTRAIVSTGGPASGTARALQCCFRH
jgi:hypothetical protein